MTKPYSKLQKKLEELESLLEKIFSLPVDSPLSHQVFSNEFVQQSAFLKKLLSAEINSHPPKPHHLHHISQRLEQLQSAYQNWENFGMSLLDHHINDASSPCSCTESCLNDDDDEGFEDDQKMIVEFTGVLDEEKGEVEEFSDCLEGEKVEEKKEEEEKVMVKIERVGVGRLCGALGGGIVLGMALMGSLMVTFYSFFQYEEQYANMLKPT